MVYLEAPLPSVCVCQRSCERLKTFTRELLHKSVDVFNSDWSLVLRTICLPSSDCFLSVTQIFQNKTGQVFDEEAAFLFMFATVRGVKEGLFLPVTALKISLKRHEMKKETLILSKSTNRKQ